MPRFNVWRMFSTDHPWLSQIPLLGMWSFGHFARGYFEERERIEQRRD